MTAATQLPQILIRNSFNILGLSSSSALKEIRKRSQQLLQLAKIEEVQEFAIDIGHVKEFRNEGDIRLALERVSGIQDRLKEIFFWFEDHRLESRKALELISNGSYQKAIAIFKTAGSDWLDKKNLALALMFHAFSSSSMDSFCQSLDAWKLISDSDDFWKFYEKHYLLHDELGTSSSLFEEFRSSLFETLSANAVSFYQQTKNPEAVGVCYSAFGRIGKTADSEVLQPIILRVKKEMEELEKTRDDVSDASVIKKILKKIHKCFSELDKFELAEYSPLIVLKNDTAEKLRSKAVDIYNENADTETARLLLNQSSKLAVSEAVLNKIEADKIQLAKNDAWKRVTDKFEKIELLIANQNFQEAKDSYLALDKIFIEEDAETSVEVRLQLLINYCSLIIQKGHELFEHKRFGVKVLALQFLLNRKSQKIAIKLFDQAIELLKNNIQLIRFDDQTNDASELLRLVKELSHSLLICEKSNLINHHEYCISKFTEQSESQTDFQTKELISLMGIASCFGSLYYRVRGIMQGKMWKWIGWTAAILFYFCTIINNDKPASNSSYRNSTYQTKPSYSSRSSTQQLTKEEKYVIEYLQKNDFEALKNARKAGYSDKQIARYVIDHAEDEE
ncbi:hypothetical protein PNK_2432 [Candidatus Protochlamydia naegleriophila]|uniref:Uncharacterized protein n=1 Tax=Candidatus Protochlamydia naegleriophila TaxID=389348 RepID=A0A0U5JGL4_9BACT|nr:hypothetical protein [Candidatus Protochlamydia naegleriophila]CUI18026.1 hypothetical protein PNK_2432 [Candidatus Protochlamydia naegleriophila]